MPNFTALLKTEISRLARKETRAALEPLKKGIAQQKAAISAMTQQIIQLEKAVKLSISTTKGARKSSASRSSLGAPGTLRFRADGFASLRKKLGLTGADMAKLLDVSIQSVYHWEAGKTKPRASQLVTIAAIKKLGKKEIASRLEK